MLLDVPAAAGGDTANEVSMDTFSFDTRDVQLLAECHADCWAAIELAQCLAVQAAPPSATPLAGDGGIKLFGLARRVIEGQKARRLEDVDEWAARLAADVAGAND